MVPPVINSIVKSVSFGFAAQYGLVITFSVFHATRFACLYVGATYHAFPPGTQAARISSFNARKVLPKRLPAAKTRKRLEQRNTVHCGRFSTTFIGRLPRPQQNLELPPAGSPGAQRPANASWSSESGSWRQGICPTSPSGIAFVRPAPRLRWNRALVLPESACVVFS